MSRVPAAIYTYVWPSVQSAYRVFFPLRRQDLRRGASRHPARLRCFQSFRTESCLITSAFSNNKKKHPKGVPFFLPHIYLWRIAHSGPRLERPHWPRAITGRERDRRPAGWTDDGGAGRKSTGSPFFKHRNHVLSSSYTTRRDERFKTELETKREKAAMTGF